MRPPIAVRVAPRREAADVARLLAGFRDYYGEDSPADEVIAATVERLFDDPATEYLLAGEPPVGFAALRFRLSAWTGVEDAWLEDVFVTEEARGRGFGRALVEASIERARERGCARIQLDVNERNAGALELYRGLGFETGSPRRWEGGRDLYFTRWLVERGK
jgi:ribosomal protein S18 acetylase RimI-like enzyme